MLLVCASGALAAGGCAGAVSRNGPTVVMGWDAEKVRYDFSYEDGVPNGEWVIFGSDGEPAVVLSFERGMCRRVATRWTTEPSQTRAGSSP